MKESSNKKKGVIVGVISAFLLVVTLGVTFAIWNYSKVGENQLLVAGDIYMKYTGTNQINASDMLPIDINNYYSDRYIINPNMTEEELSFCEGFFDSIQAPYDAGTTARSFCEGTGTAQGMTIQKMFDIWIKDKSIEDIEEQLSVLIQNNMIIKIKDDSKIKEKIPYFEFKIEGVNNYSKDIWYEIVLKDGKEPEGRTERLRDDLLRFRLVEVVGEEEKEIFTNRGYEDISDERIYVNTIGANTKEKITRTYRIYMWISDSVKVGVGEGIDYDMETWNDKVYASVKINVAGDFNEKEVNYTPLPQPASCFMSQEFDNNGKTEIMITDYDTSCGRDVVIPSKINGHEVTIIGDGYGENEGYIMPIHDDAGHDKSFYDKGLTSVVIPNTVRTIGSNAFAYNNLTKVEIPDSVTWIDDDAFGDNPLEEVKVGSGIEYIGGYAFYASAHSGDYSNFQRLEIEKTCNEIKNIPASKSNLEDKYYPWTNVTHIEGLKVYGYEEEQLKLCDTQIKRKPLPA